MPGSPTHGQARAAAAPEAQANGKCRHGMRNIVLGTCWAGTTHEGYNGSKTHWKGGVLQKKKKNPSPTPTTKTILFLG